MEISSTLESGNLQLEQTQFPGPSVFPDRDFFCGNFPCFSCAVDTLFLLLSPDVFRSRLINYSYIMANVTFSGKKIKFLHNILSMAYRT